MPIAANVAPSGLIFAVLHLPHTGWGPGIPVMFLQGITYMLARLSAGSWLGGLVAHWTVNGSILWFAWLISITWIAVGGSPA